MNIESILKKDGITVLEQLDTLTVNTIASGISEKLCDAFPNFGLNKPELFMKLSRLSMYYADMEDGLAEANYFYKNSSIYFNSHCSIEEIEEAAVHECIHYLQEIKDKRNYLIKMGLCDYSEFKIYGLGLNEAAVQLMASKANHSRSESVKYFGIDFTTNSPSYYPLECCLVEQLSYLIGEDVLFKSTLFSSNEFSLKLADATSQKTYIAIENAIDFILDCEEKIIKLNNKIAEADDRNQKIDIMIQKINNLKDEIKLTFMRTQNLIISSFFDTAFDKITKLDQIDSFRKKLYSFRDYLGTTEGYSFFEDYYIEKIAALEHKSNVIENGGMETSINIRIEEKQNFIIILFKKLKALILGNSKQTDTEKDIS